MKKEEWYRKAREDVIEECLKECNYPATTEKYLREVEITATPEHVDHVFDCGEAGRRLKKVVIEIDFGDSVLQDFRGSVEQMEIEAYRVIIDVIDTYATVCTEN